MKRKSWLKRNGFNLFVVVSMLVIAATLTAFTVTRTSPSKIYTYDDHPEHWEKAYKIGANVPVGGNMKDAEVFIAWRWDAYSENWQMSFFTCSYGQFVERVA